MSNVRRIRATDHRRSDIPDGAAPDEKETAPMAAGWEAGRPGFAGVRSAIAHAEMASPESLARIRALGDSVSIQIHMAYVGAQGTARPRPVRRPRRALTADPLTVPDDGIAANRSDLTIVGGGQADPRERPVRGPRPRLAAHRAGLVPRRAVRRMAGGVADDVPAGCSHPIYVH